MPYKDPQKRLEANRKACQKWREKNLETKKIMDHQTFQKKRQQRLEQMRINNRKAGHAERPKGPKALPEIEVPVTRRWRLHRPPDSETLIYFTTRKGFTFTEVRAILREARTIETHAKP